MANNEHLGILIQGVDIWNQWREDQPNILSDLSGASLREMELQGIDLTRADLRGTDFSDAHLSGANLSDSDLIRTNLHRADLNGANLIKANLREANLYETNFSNAFFYLTSLTMVDLSSAIGLETVIHQGPSIIGIDTLYRSKGKIPQLFLQGAGIPDEFITFIPRFVTGKATQYYSCFISYSTMDQEFAERLHSDLQGQGIRCWFAPEDIKGGRKLHEQIPEAIKLYDRLLIVLSEHSMKSEWVKTEIYHARQNEIHSGKRKLFPIGLVKFEKIRKWEAYDADAGKDMAREIREYFIPDFSDWRDHDRYKKAFDRLMRDLKAAD